MHGWLKEESPWLLGAFGTVGVRSPTAAARYSLNLTGGLATRDEQLAPWARVGLEVSGFAGVLREGAVWGWRTGLKGRIPIGGAIRQTGGRLGEWPPFLNGFPSFGGGNGVAVACAVAVIVLFAILVVGALLCIMNELEWSMEVLYPPGAPPSTSMSVSLGFAF